MLASPRAGTMTFWLLVRSVASALSGLKESSVIRGGLPLISVYMWQSEGVTARNKELLERASVYAKRVGGPWLIAGDFNMTPGQLEPEAGDWLAQRHHVQIFQWWQGP